MSSNWESLHHKAKTLEARLEKKVQNYSGIAQKINANFLCDEENPLIGSSDEQAVASEIERDLAELYDCIQHMRSCNGGSLSHHQEVMIKRYYEIHFDYSNEFKNTSATVQRKRDSMELLQQSSRNHKDDGQDSSISKLLREKTSIAASMKSINDVISQAFETKGALANQRGSLAGSGGSLSSLTANVPGFGRLIDGIQRKKSRETMVIALIIGVLLCFVIWWVFMR